MRSPPADIFVWGIHPETTSEDIVNDLAASNIIIEEKDIMRKSKEGAALLSFKISVPAQDLQKALDPAIWPLRVKVREYIYYPKKKTDNEENKKQPNPSPNDNASMTPNQQNPILAVTGTPVEVSNRFGPLANVDGVTIIQ